MSARSRLARLAPAVLAGTLALSLAGVVETTAASAHTGSLASVRTATAVGGMPVLRIGAKGAAVRTLQARLRIRVDGDFGPGTRRAVVAFQRARRLGADGVVGPVTWRALGVRAAAPAPRRAAAPRVAGRYANGRIPGAALCRLSFAPRESLRCDAAAAAQRMNSAYRARFGRNMTINDGYRSYAQQVAMKRARGRMAARPGTSNHGWGVALDLGGGVNRFGTVQHRWMRANAGRFGYVHPLWARQGGRLPEAWHWEFKG